MLIVRHPILVRHPIGRSVLHDRDGFGFQSWGWICVEAKIMPGMFGYLQYYMQAIIYAELLRVNNDMDSYYC